MNSSWEKSTGWIAGLTEDVDDSLVDDLKEDEKILDEQTQRSHGNIIVDIVQVKLSVLDQSLVVRLDRMEVPLRLRG